MSSHALARSYILASALLCPTIALALTPVASSASRRGAVKPTLAPVRPHAQRTGRPLLSADAALAGEGPPSQGAAVVPSIINLAKNIVGSGVLALAAGVAAISGNRRALGPALVVLFGLGGVSAYTFSLIARVGDDVGAETYFDTWGKVVSERSSVLVSAAITFMTCAAALSYAIIIGDSFSSIATLAGAPALLQRPNPWILIASVVLLLPLSLMRDLSALAVGSVLGNLGTLFTAGFTLLRLADGSYAPGGRFHTAIAAASRPALKASEPALGPGVFVLVSMLATAYVAHYNAPTFYKELAPPQGGGSKLPRFNKVVAGGFALAALLSAAIMSGGFLTFGAATQGLILNNYATTDALALIARVGIGASIVFSYPLNFNAMRGGFLKLLRLDKYAHRNDLHVAATVALMMAFNGLALFLKDLGLVVAVGGAVLGSAIVYIFPAIMFITNMRRKAAAGPLSAGERREVLLNKGLVALGAALGCLGAFMSLQ